MSDSQAPQFSILVLVQPPSDHLEGALRSVWAQVADSLEIVLIARTPAGRRDDLQSLVHQSSVPMRIVRGPEDGRPLAWNAGAEAATGRYLAFLDSQDEYDPERLEAFRRADAVCDGFTWGFSGVEAIDAGGRAVAVETIRDGTLRSSIYLSGQPVEAITDLPKMFTPVSCGNLVVDARAFRELGGFRDYPSLFEWDLALRLLRLSSPVTIERALYRHRVQADGMPIDGRRNAIRAAEERLDIQREFRLGLAEDGPAGGVLAMGATGPAAPPDPGADTAIAAALWVLGRMRRVPFLYVAVRGLVRLVRRVRGRPA